MKSKNFHINTSLVIGLTLICCVPASANEDALVFGLMDASTQPKFEVNVPDAFGNKIQASGLPLHIGMYEITHQTGLIDPATGEPLNTTVFGCGLSAKQASWPGVTIENRMKRASKIFWENKLLGIKDYPFTGITNGQSVVDTTIHWAYSLTPNMGTTIENAGIPTTIHVHGASPQDIYDGYPESSFSPDFAVRGPSWVSNYYIYDNDQPAATLWYHDHALGLTRLNVNAGLAGFYIIRDKYDTGKSGNRLNLPAEQYEKAYMIQDRMFKENGDLFFPAFKGDPLYDEFITANNATIPDNIPTIFGGFFGNFMVVNGKIWPKENVQATKYRLRFVNGCDSRFLVIELCVVDAGSTSVPEGAETVPYTIIGVDQGLLRTPQYYVTSSIIEASARLDIIVDFSSYQGKRIIMKNHGGDLPFTGAVPGVKLYGYTDMIMAFDVGTVSVATNTLNEAKWPKQGTYDSSDKTRRVGLFDGFDSYGRIQPVLGGEKDANVVESLGWSDAATETPLNNAIEDWEIFNFSPEAHPIHLHLVNFEVISRHKIKFASNAGPNGKMIDCSFANDDGMCVEPKVSLQHDGSKGIGFRAVFPSNEQDAYDHNTIISPGPEFSTDVGAFRDVVTALPRTVTIIRSKFTRPGVYVWHCHILSHEDHEMMRPMVVLMKQKKCSFFQRLSRRCKRKT